MEKWQYRFLLRGDKRIAKLVREGWIVYKTELGNTPLGPMIGIRLKRRGKKRTEIEGSQRVCDETFEDWNPRFPEEDPR